MNAVAIDHKKCRKSDGQGADPSTEEATCRAHLPSHHESEESAHTKDHELPLQWPPERAPGPIVGRCIDDLRQLPTIEKKGQLTKQQLCGAKRMSAHMFERG